MDRNELKDDNLLHVNGGTYSGFGLGKNNITCMICPYKDTCTVDAKDVKNCEHYNNTSHR